MANLEKREQTPGKFTYRVRWWADGKQRSKSFKSHADAKRFKAVLEGDMVNGSFIDPKHGAVSVAEFIRENADALLIDVRNSTRNRVEGIYRTHVIPEFGHLPLNGVTTSAVAQWVTRMKAELNASSVRKNAFALRRVMDLAVSYGFLRANPVTGVKLPPEPHHEQRFLTHDEAWTLAEAIHPRFRAMVLLAIFGGMRFGELCALQRMHIIPERNQVVVRQTMVDLKGGTQIGLPKTKYSIRTVTLPRSIMTELVAHMDKYCMEGGDAFVFTGVKRQVIRRGWFYRAYWLPTVKKAVMEGLRFHDLRHTFVALWVDLGRNAKEVSRAAGHSSVAFTLDHYGHLYEDRNEDLADELDNLLQTGHRRPQTPLQYPAKFEDTEAHIDKNSPSGGGCAGSNPAGGALPEPPSSEGDDER